HAQAFDISSTIPKDSWYGTLLKGVFNFQPDPTVLQLTVWAAYLLPTLAIFLGLFTRPPATTSGTPTVSTGTTSTASSSNQNTGTA
ncbi:FTR1 family protein, partial [Kitasatospora sp. NPDC057015]|uniref:FTR1 family protein n=1 Tax=Kitasatospora sp. NPDC057015 TaxID=3346001 RepID=UPI00363D48AF